MKILMTRAIKNPFILEQGKISDITKRKKERDRLVEFYWKEYMELAQQRNKIQEEIKKLLLNPAYLIMSLTIGKEQ